VYSWDLAEYDSRTVSPGWALVFSMPSMIVDGLPRMPNHDRDESSERRDSDPSRKRIRRRARASFYEALSPVATILAGGCPSLG
jgi:hypothetical protein